MSNNPNNRFNYLLFSTFVIIIDQLTKYIISVNKSLINKNLIFFSLDYVKNFGAAFNLLSGSRIFLSLLSIIVSIVILYFLLNKKNISNLDLISYSLILGGTIGNGIDRVTKGYVIDFINLSFLNFPVFNIADISINIGAILFVYSFIKYKR